MNETTNKKQLLGLVEKLKDIPYLLTLSPSKLDPLLDVLNQLVPFWYTTFNQTHYQKALILLDQLPDPFEVKLQWIEVYFAFLKYTKDEPINFKLDNFQQLLLSSANELKDPIEIKKTLQDLVLSICNFRDFNDPRRELIYKMEKLVRDKPDECSLKRKC